MESAGRWAKRTPKKVAIAANASTTASAADVSSATEPVASQPQSFATISTTAAPSTMALARRRRVASEWTWLFILRPARRHKCAHDPGSLRWNGGDLPGDEHPHESARVQTGSVALVRIEMQLR